LEDGAGNIDGIADAGRLESQETAVSHASPARTCQPKPTAVTDRRHRISENKKILKRHLTAPRSAAAVLSDIFATVYFSMAAAKAAAAERSAVKNSRSLGAEHECSRSQNMAANIPVANRY